MPTSETDVGITAWANDSTGFTAILKQRWITCRTLPGPQIAVAIHTVLAVPVL